MNHAEGHRERVKNAYLENRLAGMADHNILELILFYAIPRKDTKQLARDLLAHFGGDLNRVFQANVEELECVKGIGESAAILLTLFGEVSRRTAAQKNKGIKRFADYHVTKEYCHNLLDNLPTERMLLITLDNQDRLIRTHTIAEGTVNAASVEPRKLVQAALTDNAAALIVAHNHPAGNFLPSQEDVAFTKNLSFLLRKIGIHLKDHVIVGEGGSISMRNDIRYIDLFS